MPLANAKRRKSTRNAAADRSPTRDVKPARSSSRRLSTPRVSRKSSSSRQVEIPREGKKVEFPADGKIVTLTNLSKLFWPELKITKGDLIQYYADIAPVLLPHLRDRGMVMKRYPNGAGGPFFFMKRAPVPRPEWIRTCSIPHAAKGPIDFPVVQDLPTLLWTINLGCIDLNPWYARCDDPDRPDYLHFDLDPVEPLEGQKPVPFSRVLEVALIVRNALDRLDMPSYPKTTGSRGVHIYVPIQRGPLQKQVWTVAEALARTLAKQEPNLITAQYRIAKRPAGRVLVDYNQNAWGRTLASVYSVRPKPHAPVSMPLTWKEVEKGITIEQFTLKNAAARIKKLGDLWAPLLPDAKPRVDLSKFVSE
jgi:bifunctional non-homologous end joining protein LigD